MKRGSKYEAYLGEWVKKQIRLFKAGLVPRRRLRTKTKLPKRMSSDRMRRIEEFLREDGK